MSSCRRGRFLARAGSVAAALATCLLSLAPATASVVYCIGQPGHSGFELVAGGESGCAGCCHDAEHRSADGDTAANAGECVDVLVSVPQDLPRTGCVAADAGTPALPLVQPAPATMPRGRRTSIPNPATPPPAASSPSAWIAFTVLTI